MTAQEAKHTAGPWKASKPDGEYHDVIRIFSDPDPAGSKPVAICPQRQSAIMSVLCRQKNETTEAAANARLIAAAPELLEALKAIVNSDMAMREEDEGQNSSPLNLARAAIRKSEGVS